MSGTLQYFEVRLRKFAEQLRYLPRTLAIVWQVSGRLTALWVLLLIIQGLLPIATVYLTRAIVNSLVLAIRSGGQWSAVRPTLVLAVWMGAVVLAMQLLRSVTIWVRTAQSEMVRDHIAGLIQRKSLEMDLAFYDSSDFYDHLHRARMEASYRPVQLIDGLGALLQNGITVTAMLAILIPFGLFLPLALFLSTLPALYVVIRAGLRRHQWNQRATVEDRRSWYYDTLLTAGESAAEMRLFRLGDYFLKAFQDVRRHLRYEQLKIARQQGFGELWAGLAALATTGTAMAWMIWRAIRGLVSLGDLALFYQAFNQGLGLARTLLENIGQLYENSLFLGNLFEFLELQPQVTTPLRPRCFPAELTEGIRFENVTFRYPRTERVALRNFNMKVKPGQCIALVGPNGAGKSTLIKLLCRFYDPEEGAILVDGISLREFALEELRRRITVLFQAPVQYNATAASNIRYGDIGLSHASAPEAVATAAEAAGADGVIERLPNRYATQLGRWFVEGTELSIGEWQRIALARASIRPAQIVILDEPTSAMDPWAEIEWAERFSRFAKGRIAIIITHRLTTAMFADVIHVISEGQVVESGTHQQLLASGGLYARGWEAQTRS